MSRATRRMPTAPLRQPTKPPMAPWDRLMSTMPNAVTGREYGMDEFINKAQMQLTINDDDSYLAALVALTKYGKHVVAWAAEDRSDLHILLSEEGEDACEFYNDLPEHMRSYKGECSEIISETPRFRGW